MSDLSTAELRKKFNTAEGRAAFDRVNALGPRWVFSDGDGEERKLYLSPSIEIKTRGGGLLSGFGAHARRGMDIDELMIRIEQSMINEAERPNKLIVVNAGGANRREYRYDAEQKDFVLYSGTIDSGKPFSIKLKKP